MTLSELWHDRWCNINVYRHTCSAVATSTLLFCSFSLVFNVLNSSYKKYKLIMYSLHTTVLSWVWDKYALTSMTDGLVKRTISCHIIISIIQTLTYNIIEFCYFLCLITKIQPIFDLWTCLIFLFAFLQNIPTKSSLDDPACWLW